MVEFCIGVAEAVGTITTTLTNIIVSNIILEKIYIMENKTESGRKGTARNAVKILLGEGYYEPSSNQRKNLVAAYEEKGKILKKNGFDMIKFDIDINLDDLHEVKENIDNITICEVKSTNREAIKADFSGYFFDITDAEDVSAKSVGDNFKFIFVNTITNVTLTLTIDQIEDRIKNEYPKRAVRI